MKKQLNFLTGTFVLAALSASAQLDNYNSRDFIPETNPGPLYVATASAATAKPGYTLIWSDEFNNSTDAALYTNLGNYWNYAAYNSMNTYYGTSTEQKTHIHTASTDHAGSYAMSISLDKLVSPPTGYEYGSAFVMSNQRFIYGYYEARVKLENGRGAWPSFWLFGNNGFNTGEGGSSYAGSYGEIDMFENFPNREDAREVTFNAHAWHYDGTANAVADSYDQHLSNSVNTRVYYAGDIDLADEYHIFSIDFSPTAVKYYLDGHLLKTITDGTFLAKLAKQGMRVSFDNALETSLKDYSTPTSMHMYIDYVRVYKKNQVLSMTGNTCNMSGNTITLSAAQPDWYSTLPTGKTISYQWSVTGSSASISGSSTSSTVTISSPGNGTFVATCSVDIHYPDFYTTNTTYTATVWHEIPVEKFTYPNSAYENTFSIGAPQCVSSQIQVTVSNVTNPPGGLWQLWNTDVNGNFTGSALQSGYGTSYTFINLTQGTVYAVTRGVWTSCTPWNFVQQNFTANLTDFSLSAISCTGTGNKFQVTCTALSNTGTGSTTQWQLYTCDAAGNTSGTPVNASGTSYTYNNLVPGSYYKIFRNASGGCTALGSSTSKVIYVPDYILDPFFSASSTVYSNPVYSTLTGVSGASAPVSWWGVYNSNAAGSPLSTIGSPQYSNGTVNFGPANGYWLNTNTNYYLLVRAVYGECSNWYWKGKLFHNGNFSRLANPNEGVDVEFTPEQIAMLEQSVGLAPSHAVSASLSLVPNPATNNVLVTPSGFTGAVTVELVNLQGETLEKIVSDGASQAPIDLEKYPAGIYLVRMYNDAEAATARLIRE